MPVDISNDQADRMASLGASAEDRETVRKNAENAANAAGPPRNKMYDAEQKARKET